MIYLVVASLICNTLLALFVWHQATQRLDVVTVELTALLAELGHIRKMARPMPLNTKPTMKFKDTVGLALVRYENKNRIEQLAAEIYNRDFPNDSLKSHGYHAAANSRHPDHVRVSG